MSLTIALPAGSENLRGILAMLAAMASLIVNDAFIKIAAADLPLGEAIFLRGLFTTLMCAGLLVATAGPSGLRLVGARGVPMRTWADIAATLLYLSALARMPIADSTAILQFTPLAIMAGAALFFQARVGWRRWLAALTGLIGVLLIVRPGSEAFNPYASLAVAAIAFVAARDLLTRRVAPQVPVLAIATASAAGVMMASLALMPVEAWQWPSARTFLMLFCSGVGLLGGHYGIIVAMRSGEIAVVAPFRYSIILYAVIAGFLVWGELPDLLSWIGIAIVTGAGLYTLFRERRLARTTPS
jgi:drug/metabolite transporter (DMT)-like permease